MSDYNCYEVNAPALIVTAAQEAKAHLEKFGLTGEHLVEAHDMLEVIEGTATALIQWLRCLDEEGQKPTITWTEFVHRAQVRAQGATHGEAEGEEREQQEGSDHAEGDEGQNRAAKLDPDQGEG